MSVARQIDQDSLASDSLKVEFRLATFEDVPEIYELLLAMHEEVGLATLAPLKVLQTIEAVLANGFVMLATKGEQVIGAVGLDVREWWYSNDSYLGDRWTFVHPDHRSPTTAPRLLAKALEVADKTGLPVVMGVLSPHDVERKNKLFRRHLTPVGEGVCQRIRRCASEVMSPKPRRS